MNITPPNNLFESQIVKYINTEQISPVSFKKFVRTNVLETYNALTLFGSIVYDPDNANDIDVFGIASDLHNLHKSLNKYFDVIHHINDIDNEMPTGDYKIHCIEVSYKNIFLTKIDLVNEATYRNLPTSDFIETSMIRTSKGLSMRFQDPKIDVTKALENIKNKILTPTEEKIIEIQRFDEMGCRIPGGGLVSLLACMVRWKRIFKKQKQGFKFKPMSQGFEYVVPYDKFKLDYELRKILYDPTRIVLDYLENMLFSPTNLCDICRTKLSINDSFPFVVRTHVGNMNHGNCIFNAVKAMCDPSSRKKNWKLVTYDYYVDYMKTF